jgi:hypothetical protein
MKTVRLITILVIAILIFSAWPPSPAYAQGQASSVSIGASGASDSGTFVTAKMVKLTVNNKTGGTLYVTLTGQRFYSFVVTNQGKSRYDIEAGRYTYTVRTSACAGSISKTVNFKGGGTLGPYVCNKK